MKILTFILIFNLLFASLHAQYNPVILSGEIQYDFKVNQYERARKILGTQINEPLYGDYVQSLNKSKFINRQYTLAFNSKYSFFERTQKTAPVNNLDFVIDFPTEVLVRNLMSDSIDLEKNVAGELIRIKDKSISIIWKFTNERMDILGYECRRANGLLSDSVYVVAFYCPDIPITGGPSIFGGLPGMILGISLPHDNINIFATNILIKEIGINPNLPTEKSTRSFAEYKKFMKNTFSRDLKGDQRLEFNLRTLFL